MYVDYLHCLYASVHLQGCSHLQWRLFRSPHNVSVGASVVGCSQAWSQWDHRVGKRALQEIVASQEDQIQSVVFYTDTFDFLISCVLHVSLGLPEWEILMLSLPEANISQKKLSIVMHFLILSVLMIDLMFKRHTGYLSWFILQHSLQILAASFTLGMPSCSKHGQGIALSGDFAFDPRWCNLQPHNRGFGSLS